jgi:hypothetical protein
MALQTAIYTLLIGTVTIVPTAIEHNEQWTVCEMCTFFVSRSGVGLNHCILSVRSDKTAEGPAWKNVHSGQVFLHASGAVANEYGPTGEL